MRKICSACKKNKPYGEFAPDKRSKTGLYARCRKCHSEYAKRNPTKKEKSRKYISDWRRRNRLKANAHEAVYQALKRGKISPEPCARCGEKAQAHHEDYAKPLQIAWLCIKHHGERHREINRKSRGN